MVVGLTTEDGAQRVAYEANDWSGPTVTVQPNSFERPVRWIRVRERGIVGMAPEPEPAWFVNSTAAGEVSAGSVGTHAKQWSPVNLNGTVRPGRHVYQTAAPGLKTAQVSRLIRIARDWSKQAEEASTYQTNHVVENGVPILNQPPAISFNNAFVSYLIDGSHRLVPRDENGERGWFTLWRLRAARALLQGASAHAILAALRGQLAELRAGLASFVASAARTHASQLLRLSHFIVPNAPPAHLIAQVTY
jgi:hypothetical protein